MEEREENSRGQASNLNRAVLNSFEELKKKTDISQHSTCLLYVSKDNSSGIYTVDAVASNDKEAIQAAPMTIEMSDLVELSKEARQSYIRALELPASGVQGTKEWAKVEAEIGFDIAEYAVQDLAYEIGMKESALRISNKSITLNSFVTDLSKEHGFEYNNDFIFEGEFVEIKPDLKVGHDLGDLVSPLKSYKFEPASPSNSDYSNAFRPIGSIEEQEPADLTNTDINAIKEQLKDKGISDKTAQRGCDTLTEAALTILLKLIGKVFGGKQKIFQASNEP